MNSVSDLIERAERAAARLDRSGDASAKDSAEGIRALAAALSELDNTPRPHVDPSASSQVPGI